MKKIFVMIVMMAALLSYGICEAVQTKLVVRARSKDAKFLGTKMGGARIVIKDAGTGRVLSEGLTSGGTGDTQKIMIEPKTRFGNIAEGAAKFETAIDIDEPVLITIEVEGPYIHKDNMIKSTTQVWMIPGRDIVGEGLIIELPGFSIDASAPGAAKLVNGEAVVPLQAHIVMIWGCALTPGGLWDSNKYEISAVVKREGQVTGAHPLSFAGPSTFSGELKLNKTGNYEIIVYAFDPLTGNTGVDKVKLKVN